MSLFPWESQLEMVAWFALFSGLWNYSDQLSASMLQQGFTRQNAWWLRYGAASLAVGCFPIFYLGSDLLVGEATRLAEVPLTFTGRMTAAGVMAFGAMLLIATARLVSLQREVLVHKVLFKWDFEFDEYLDEQVWMGGSIPELCSLNSRLGRGRLSLAVMNSDGEVVSLGVRRSHSLHFDPQEPFQLTSWVALEGGHSVAVWFRTEEDRRMPLEEEISEVNRLVAALTEKKLKARYVLFHNGSQVHTLYSAPPTQLPQTGQGLFPLNRESTHTL
ncbi:hypothetical protein H1S01_04680 [Heliobacterium chlorum]|uniref:Uncharacterized protein n=1 Tax=Heliobacterium chlorum TaxID=2698 RepID=A0ABR7T2B9_HELCL|nr:hypothetical protein [Heliobacterium chlorum]MBC9783806.1 hypothetical protein [Heliobacterium chlorum]